jgi:hypothetical protein
MTAYDKAARNLKAKLEKKPNCCCTTFGKAAKNDFCSVGLDSRGTRTGRVEKPDDVKGPLATQADDRRAARALFPTLQGGGTGSGVVKKAYVVVHSITEVKVRVTRRGAVEKIY